MKNFGTITGILALSSVIYLLPLRAAKAPNSREHRNSKPARLDSVIPTKRPINRYKYTVARMASVETIDLFGGLRFAPAGLAAEADARVGFPRIVTCQLLVGLRAHDFGPLNQSHADHMREVVKHFARRFTQNSLSMSVLQ
jgi:hypothetical protein